MNKPFVFGVAVDDEHFIGKRVELKILPLGKDYPIYLQQAQRAELDQAPNGILLSLDSIQVIERQTNTVE